MSDEQWANQVPEDEFSFDSGDVDAGDVGSRIYVDKKGMYHFEIGDAKLDDRTQDDNGKFMTPHILVPSTVIHTVPGQSAAGAMYYERLAYKGEGGGPAEDWQRKATLAFLLGVGLLKAVDGKIVDPKTGTTSIDIKSMPDRLKNLQWIGDIKHNAEVRNPDQSVKYREAFKLNFGRGAWRVDAPEVKQVQKNVEALKLIPGIDLAKCLPDAAPQGNQPAAKGNGKAAKPAPASTPAPQQAAASAPAPSPAPAPAAAATVGAADYSDL